jgi:hypothetical protein
MRLFALLAAALLLSSCTWVRHEMDFAPAPPLVVAPKPDAKPPHRPRVDHPVVPTVAAPAAAAPAAVPAPPPDYNTRCRAMADNRADDAKQLGASTADQAKVQTDTYRDCMAQSVK